MPPLSPGELNAAFAFGGVTRGVVVALASAIVISFFAPMGVAHWWAVLFFVLAASLALALMGVLAGVWAEKFDHMQAVTNFIITPLAFLSGTFYSVERLPEVARGISSYNPFFCISMSTTLPCTLETRIEDDVLAKAFWITVIMMRPGPRKAR